MVAPIYREWFILSTIIIQNVATGISYGYPSILTPAITSNSSNVIVNREEASWITASYSMSAAIGNIFIPNLMQSFGRRYTNMGINIITLVGSIIIASAPNFTTLIIGRAVQGLIDSKLFLCNIFIGEYSNPKRRGVTVTLKFAAVNSGLLICVGLSTLLTWRQIAWLQGIPSILGLVFTFVWPESPSWLAYKGRYRDCQEAFQWVRGSGLESEKELRELLAAQRELGKTRESAGSFSRYLKVGFLKPLFILSVLIWFAQSSGQMYLYAYIVEIMIDVTGNKSDAFYFSLCVGLIKLLGSIVSGILITRFQRRLMLFSTGTLSVCLLGLTSLLNYFNSINVLALPLLPAVMLVLYNFAIHLVIPVVAVATGELFPLEYKGIGISLIMIIWSVLGSVTLKCTSNMITLINTYGTFGVYLLAMSSALFVLFFILPEAKDRTLQDIENKFLDLKLTDKEETAAEMAVILKT